MELALLTSGNEDVLHDGDGFEKSHSIVPSLATARREGKERKLNLFGGVKFSRVLRANSTRRVQSACMWENKVR